MISEHAEEWLGYPVTLFDAARAEKPVTDYAKTIYRIALDWDAKLDFPELFAKFLANPASAQTPAIIIGQFHGNDPSEGSGEVVQALVSAHGKLPNLRGIFIGDLITEESEVSWINQCDVSPLLMAYPNLEHLRLRGTSELSFGGRLVHQNLKSLTVETGGLPPELFKEIMASKLPSLEKLELWLGTPSYGGDVTAEDLEPLLAGDLFPTVKHLGLRDSEIVDQIAEKLRDAVILSFLETLDLSLGNLSDEGAEALLDNPQLKSLKHIDLHHHYLSKEMIKHMAQVFPGWDLSDAQDEADPDDRYVAVGE